jgi:hypothetical protein
MRRTVAAGAGLWAVVLVAWAGPAAAAPGMSWGQWTSQELTFGECVQRTPRALSREGFSIVERHGRTWFATGEPSGLASATVSCYGLARGTIVTVAAAAVGPGGALRPVVQRLADSIFLDEEAAPAPGSPPATSPAPATGGGGWDDNADRLAGQVGKRFTWTCPPGGRAPDYVIWGTGTYASGSRVCVAAVHDGVITTARGGTVTLQILPGLGSYTGSSGKGGVISLDTGQSRASFVFVEALPSRAPSPAPAAPPATAPRGGAGWDASATHLAGRNGRRFTYSCPAGGSARDYVIWGTDVYADGSVVCVAAVHAGVITAARGGTVTIEIAPSPGSFAGSTRNGVVSLDAGGTHASFRFVR